MNYTCTIKSVLCSLMLGTVVATSISTTQTQAFSPKALYTFAKAHKKILTFASLAIPIFGLYARKTISSLIHHRERQPDDGEIDYFEKFADAFSKTAGLIGKIFKVTKVFTGPDNNLLDSLASL